MLKKIYIIFTIFFIPLALYNIIVPYISYESITEEDVVRIETIFDFYYYRNPRKAPSINEFHFVDHPTLYIDEATLTYPMGFRDVFLNMESGKVMNIGYDRNSDTIVELSVDGVDYINLEYSIEWLNHDNVTRFVLNIIFSFFAYLASLVSIYVIYDFFTDKSI